MTTPVNAANPSPAVGASPPIPSSIREWLLVYTLEEFARERERERERKKKKKKTFSLSTEKRRRKVPKVYVNVRIITNLLFP